MPYIYSHSDQFKNPCIFESMKKKSSKATRNRIQMVSTYDHKEKLTEIEFVAPKGYNLPLRTLTAQEVLANRPKDAKFIFA